MNIITRQEAKEKGLKTYFTGILCKNGHQSERYVSNSICIECQSKSNQTHWNKNQVRLVKENENRRKKYGKRYNENRRQKYHNDEEFNKKIKSYASSWYEVNRESVLNDKERKIRMKKYRSENKERMSKQSKAWRRTNRIRVNQTSREYQKTKRDYYTSQNAKYRANKKQSVPIWAESERKEINDLYLEANLLSKSTGILHEVDHIIPLQGKNVCGLHCLANLQILPLSENRKKSNRLTV